MPGLRMFDVFVLNGGPRNKFSPVTCEEQHFSWSSIYHSAANAAGTPLSEHLNPNPQHFLLFSPYFREPHKGFFLLRYSRGCTDLSAAQFCWHTCHVPCCSGLTQVRQWKDLTFSWSAGFAGICRCFFRREKSSWPCPSSDGRGRNSLGITGGGRS